MSKAWFEWISRSLSLYVLYVRDRRMDLKIGKLDLTCVSDGILASSEDFVLNLDLDTIRRISGADTDGTLRIPVNIFVFRRGAARILVDAGAGNSMQPTLGRLPTALEECGVSPASITHILLTHLHPDHANGLIDDNGDAVFPNAEILVHKVEYDYWMAPGNPSEDKIKHQKRARNQQNLAPYVGRIHTVTEGEETLGCIPILTSGHSPGHTCWQIDTGTEPLLAWGDIVHFPTLQIPYPDTGVKYDLDSREAAATRHRVFERVVSENMLIAGAHLPAPGVGRLVHRDSQYIFVPLDPSE